MKSTARLTCALMLALAPFGLADATLTVDVTKPGVAISPSLYGIFFEEINFAGDGGLYPELLRNRNFEDNAERPEFWSLVLRDGAKGDATLRKSERAAEFNKHFLRLTREKDSTGVVGIANDGYWGVPVRKGETYQLQVRARWSREMSLTASLENRAGVKYATVIVSNTNKPSEEFETLTLTLPASATDPSARLVLSIDEPGSVDLDYVSLMPAAAQSATRAFAAPKLGAARYRSDLFDKLKDLKPAFMRFPGGCWVEGETMATASRWKRTLGPLSERWTQPNLWGYHSTNGLGYHEYLQLCEDLGASALFVINVGMSHRENVPMDQMGDYVQDALDAIEYATGPADSKYGKMRADAGHPEPFKLEFMEIGNENGGPAYNERYTLFYDAIKAKYPQIKLVACDWWNGRPKDRPIEILDEHYYDTPQFFFRNASKYDSYDRGKYKVYVGEYAVTKGCGAGNLIAAVGEAAFMTGMERNSDVVVMSSYAPLFTHVSGKRWNPDMINFDSGRSYGTPSYHVQQLFAQNRGDVVLPVDVKVSGTIKPEVAKGGAGVGTWSTQAEFKDFKVTGVDGKVLYQAGFTNSDGWNFNRQRGFVARNGVLAQRGNEEDTRATVGDPNWTDYTVEVKARKTGGDEGFLVLTHADDGGNFVWFNVGGWGNNRTSIERNFEGGKEEIGKSTDFKVEPDRWYDLKVEVKGDEIRGYVDGKLLSTAKDERKPMNKVFATASRDNASGDVIIKFVNGGDSAQPAKFTLNGVSNLSNATAQVLAGRPEDENTLDAPTKVSPREAQVNISGSSLSYDAPAYSVTIVRVKGS